MDPPRPPSSRPEDELHPATSNTTTAAPSGTPVIHESDPTLTISPSRNNTPSRHVSPVPSTQQTPPQVAFHTPLQPARTYDGPPQSNPRRRDFLTRSQGRDRDQTTSIRIRRIPSASSNLSRQPSNTAQPAHLASASSNASGGRRRSHSAPQRPSLEALGSAPVAHGRPPMECLPEEGPRPSGSYSAYVPEIGLHRTQTAPDIPPGGDAEALRPAQPNQGPGMLRRASVATRGLLGFNRRPHGELAANPEDGTSVHIGEYGPEVVDLLDVVDPEVSTLTTLTNVQNSLFVPDLGGWINRRPTYTITRPLPTEQVPSPVSEAEEPLEEGPEAPGIQRTTTHDTIDSTLSDSRYAVLPHGMSLDGWEPGEKEELNDHVRHMLHSRRSRFKRSLKGFGQYVRRPLGFLVTLYAVLITLFGLAWVLFLIGWIYVGDRQLYVIHIIDSVLVALFAIMGDGLAPFRAVDTYHMIFIAKYGYKTWEVRKKRGLPKLKNKNDFPARQPGEPEPEPKPINPDDAAAIADQKFKAQREAEKGAEGSNTPTSPDTDVENEAGTPTDPDDPLWEFTVLTPKEQQRLSHHQKKFARSHTFYKPHETSTHYAFPLRLMIAIVVLLDCHSLLQIALGACTWGIYYKVRPMAITTVILCCSITCNITAGVLISVGDRRSRKNDVLELLNRQELTKEAVHHLEKKREKERKKSMEGERGRKSLDIQRRTKSLDLATKPEIAVAERARKSMDVFRRRRSVDSLNPYDGA